MNVNIEEIRKVKLDSDDVLVLRLPFAITQEGAIKLRETVSAVFPGHKCFILDKGISLEILTRNDIDALGV